MKLKALPLLIGLLLTLCPYLVGNHTTAEAQLGITNTELDFKQTLCTYDYDVKNLANWFLIEISRNTTGPTGTIINQEYVGFSKTTRGDIGFTYQGEYIARLIPIVAGKIGGNWWLVPIRNVPTVSALSSENTTDYLEIYYTGSGTFTAYKYDEYGTQNTVDLQINRIGIKIDKKNAQCKITADVTRLGGSLEDTGFGFLFYPQDAQKFRYANIEVGNTTQAIDLADIHKINNVTAMIEFWGSQRLGIKWNWEDLYELGNNTHFEVLQVAGITGLLTGSYGYGAGSRIIVDPTLTISEDTGCITVINTWSEGGSTVGYNFTVTSAQMIINQTFSYSANAMMGGTQGSDQDSYGWLNLIVVGAVYSYSRDCQCQWTILEDTTERLQLGVYSTTLADGDWNFTWILTAYAGSPVLLYNVTAKNQDAGTLTIADYYMLLWSDPTDDDSWDYTTSSSGADDRGAWYDGTLYGMGAFGIYFDLAGYDPDNIGTWNDRIEYRETADRDVTTGSSVTFTMACYFHEESTSAGASEVAEMDNEMGDDFADITDTLGLTYDGRNNETGSYDFTHSSGNNANFTFAPVDTESNFTSFYITEWNTTDLNVEQNGTTFTEDTDYNATFINPGLDFRREGDHVTIADDPSINFSCHMTLELWLRLDEYTVGHHQRLMQNTPVANNKGWTLQENAGSFYLYIYIGGWKFANTDATAYIGQWIHLVGTYDNETITLYVNGVSKDTTTQTGNIDQPDDPITCLFSDYAMGPSTVDGGGDEFRMYNRSLSPSEISYSYTNKYPENTTGLVLWYRCDEASGTSLTDSSGEGNTGTLVNGPTWIKHDACASNTSSVVDLHLFFLDPVSASSWVINTPPNNSPTVGSFTASKTTWEQDKNEWVSVTIDDADGVADFVNCSLVFDDDWGHTFTLLWDNVTDTFSENSDPSNYVTLATCTRTTDSGTAYTLKFIFLIRETYPEEPLDVEATVIDSSDANGTGTSLNLFTFKHPETQSGFTMPKPQILPGNFTEYKPISGGSFNMPKSNVWMVAIILIIGVVLATLRTPTKNLKSARKNMKSKVKSRSNFGKKDKNKYRKKKQNSF